MNTLEDLKKSIEKRKENPFLRFWDFVCYIYYRIEEMPSNIKYRYQRSTRGYADYDVWGLNTFIIEKIRPVLKEYVTHQAEHGMSTPMEFATDPAKWLDILREMEYSFDEQYREDIECSDEFHKEFMNMSDEQIKVRRERIQKGFELFGKFLTHLWD